MAERRRGQDLEDALLDAAWAELLEHGYASFTMESVAARAGTSRPVIRRRWTDRLELLLATLTHVADRQRTGIPDTGSLRGDLLWAMRTVNETGVELIATISVHLAGYYEQTGSSPKALRDALAGSAPGVFDEVFERAVERGEIDAEQVTPRLRSLPFDLLRQEIILTLAPVPDAELEEIVDTVFLPLARRPGAA